MKNVEEIVDYAESLIVKMLTDSRSCENDKSRYMLISSVATLETLLQWIKEEEER